MDDKGDLKLEVYEDEKFDVSSLEGSISPVLGNTGRPDLNNADLNTLDEPIYDTIMRDVKAVGVKFFHVLVPKDKTSLLKEWDLWGPLILCTFMAMILQGQDVTNDTKSDGGPAFAEVFVIVWVGSIVVTLNTKLLGGCISFFQSVCVLGYCLLPLALALLSCRIILMAERTTIFFITRCIIVTIGFAWATFASMTFFGGTQPQDRKALAVYPMFLFYFVISWLVVSHSID